MAESSEPVLFTENDWELNVDNTFVVTNLPIITPEKEEKFCSLLRHTTAPYSDPRIKIPFDDSGRSKGYQPYLLALSFTISF